LYPCIRAACSYGVRPIRDDIERRDRGLLDDLGVPAQHCPCDVSRPYESAVLCGQPFGLCPPVSMLNSLGINECLRSVTDSLLDRDGVTHCDLANPGRLNGF
jgi:hypothetical protein